MDCTFYTMKGIFNYRVVAIIHNDGRFLMAYDADEDIYYSVGGRVRLNETMKEALKREVREECGILDFDFRLLAIHENFFDEVHEISIYFEILNPEAFTCIPNGHLTKEGPAGEKLVWLTRDELNQPNVYPDFLSRLNFSSEPSETSLFTSRKSME